MYSMTFIDPANATFTLEEYEKAFEVIKNDTGQTFLMGVKLVQTAVDFDKDGQDDVVHTEVFGRLIDPATNDTQIVGNGKVKVGPHSSTIYLSELEDNGLSIDDIISDNYERCVQRVINRKQSLLSLVSIPGVTA